MRTVAVLLDMCMCISVYASHSGYDVEENRAFMKYRINELGEGRAQESGSSD